MRPHFSRKKTKKWQTKKNWIFVLDYIKMFFFDFHIFKNVSKENFSQQPWSKPQCSAFSCEKTKKTKRKIVACFQVSQPSFWNLSNFRNCSKSFCWRVGCCFLKELSYSWKNLKHVFLSFEFVILSFLFWVFGKSKHQKLNVVAWLTLSYIYCRKKLLKLLENF